MLEGGSRVPLIVSWPAATPKGKVVEDIVSFADCHATFAELAGGKLPAGFKTDGQNFASQLRSESGNPRKWAYVQLGQRWYVREPGYKLDKAGNLFDMSDAPFVEKLIPPAADTAQSKAARERLTAALAELDPAAGKIDRDADGGNNRRVARATGPWKSGDRVPGPQTPLIANKSLDISAEIEPAGGDGLIVSQGGSARGYALYLSKGKLTFGVREDSQLTTIAASEPLASGRFSVEATLHGDGAMALSVDGKKVAEGKAPGGLIMEQPKAGLFVGATGKAVVGDYTAPFTFAGKISNVRVKTAAP
jgi:hypothetical protein